jgi:heme-degrading monooxygenase HmoA
MTVKILIKRKVTKDNMRELIFYLNRLRSLTLNQNGYIYGETLKSIDNPGECLVISTWRSLPDWQSWLANNERIAIQNEIDRLLGEKTEYSAYEV